MAKAVIATSLIGTGFIAPETLQTTAKAQAETVLSTAPQQSVRDIRMIPNLTETAGKFEEFVEEKKLDKFSFIAHSAGGHIATSYIAKNQNKATSVIATLDTIKDRAYFIVGDGQKTVGKIAKSYIYNGNEGMDQHTDIAERVIGDGTVPSESAAVNKRYADKTYYTDAIHETLITNPTVAQQGSLH